MNGEKMSKRFPNLAGDPLKLNTDDIVKAELTEVGIDIVTSCIEHNPEVHTKIVGQCSPWSFVRYWYYWVATGPGIPPADAAILFEKYGKECRANGDCACRPYYDWNKGFAVDTYHCDTVEGLKALADLIKEIRGRI